MEHSNKVRKVRMIREVVTPVRQLIPIPLCAYVPTMYLHHLPYVNADGSEDICDLVDCPCKEAKKWAINTLRIEEEE